MRVDDLISRGERAEHPGDHFVEVVEGQDVADKISNLPKGAQDRPKTDVVVKSVTIERV